MRFRPCIDLHDGKVKQIVGASLKDLKDASPATSSSSSSSGDSKPVENFVSAEPAAHYAELTRIAQAVAVDKLIVVTAADWDYRALAWNWLAHVRQYGHTNAVVLSMDRELHLALTSAGATSFDNSANLDAWNRTCLQRHIQAVRTERHLAMAALAASGLDVLLTCAPPPWPRAA